MEPDAKTDFLVLPLEELERERDAAERMFGHLPFAASAYLATDALIRLRREDEKRKAGKPAGKT